MAFASGKESTEAAAVKRFIGVAAVEIRAVNPSKEELSKIYDTTIDKDIAYVSDVEGVKSARIDFVVEAQKSPRQDVEFKTKVTFFVRNEKRYNKDKTKTQVIDKYGRTAWVTAEELKNHSIPQYSNGPANLDPDYRQVFVGEEDLTNFIINYLNIPSVQRYVDGKWVMVEHPEECEARLENIEKYFVGDFKELKDIISLQPNNRVKVLFGVRTTDDGKQYQAAYTQMTLKNNVINYDRLQKDLDERKAAGAYSTTEFTVCPVKEYTVEATNFGTNDPLSGDSQVMDTPW